MPSGYRSGGVDFDDLFDPFVQGPTSVATGRRIAGVDLSYRYAHIQYGAKRADVGYRVNGTDLSNLWAAKGTAVYSLPINGREYTRSRGRGGASLAFNMLSNGTYSIVNDLGTVLDSGSWLPAGDAVASYSCKFSQSGFTNGLDIGGGNDTYTNEAPAASALTTSRSFTAGAVATTINTNASNIGTVTMQLYKSGVLRSTTSISFQLDAAGT